MAYAFNDNKTKVDITKMVDRFDGGGIVLKQGDRIAIIDGEGIVREILTYNDTANATNIPHLYFTTGNCGELNVDGMVSTNFAKIGQAESIRGANTPITFNSGIFTSKGIEAEGNSVISGTLNVRNTLTIQNGKRLNCVGVYENTTTSNANVYVNSSGNFLRHVSSSSKTIKHDIKPLEDEGINAEKLYDVDVVQCKYNDGIVSEDDPRYGKDFPAFIIEDLDEKYPIAVDKSGKSVKEWSWNPQYLIPPMLKLIQEQKAEIDELRKEIEDIKNAK